MEGLEHDADGVAADFGQPVLAQPREIVAGDKHPARCRGLKAGHHHQERRFSRAARANQRDGLALGHRKVYASQDFDRPRPAVKRERDVLQADGQLRAGGGGQRGEMQ